MSKAGMKLFTVAYGLDGSHQPSVNRVRDHTPHCVTVDMDNKMKLFMYKWYQREFASEDFTVFVNCDMCFSIHRFVCIYIYYNLLNVIDLA